MAYRHVEAIQDMARLWDVTAYGPNRFGHLVVSESDAKALREIAFAEPRLRPMLPEPSWGDITIETAPDWTCDPLAVASARLIATLFRPIRHLLRWLTRTPAPALNGEKP